MNSDPITETDAGTRRRIAIGIVIGGASVVCALGLAVIIASIFNAQLQQSAQLVLTSILPLVGTWIGTVLAFYFAKDNFEAASRVTKELVGVQERLKSILVRDAMIPRSQIDAFKLGESVIIPAIGGKAQRTVTLPSEPNAVLITDALDFMAAKKRNRLPVFNTQDAGVYVIHVSTLDRFRSAHIGKSVTGLAADANTWTLADFQKADPELFKSILAWAVVGKGATLADAKQAMEATPNCIDVLVTDSGKKDSPVVGWLTNIEIGQRSQA